MPREIENLSVRTAGRKATHDWASILDGKAREFTSGEDFTCKPESFIGQARNVASDTGVKIATRMVENGNVQIQAQIAPVSTDEA